VAGPVLVGEGREWLNLRSYRVEVDDPEANVCVCAKLVMPWYGVKG
jgi:hypothetical protein